jgi:hypothetical protein
MCGSLSKRESVCGPLLGQALAPDVCAGPPQDFVRPTNQRPSKKFVDNSIMNLKVRCQRQHEAKGGTTEEGRQL